MLKVTRSRRVAGLKPSDYDHEIATVDHEGLSPSPSPDPESTANFSRVSTTARLLRDDEGEQGESSTAAPRDDNVQIQERPAEELRHEQELPHEALRPSIEVQGMSSRSVSSNTC